MEGIGENFDDFFTVLSPEKIEPLRANFSKSASSVEFDLALAEKTIREKIQRGEHMLGLKEENEGPLSVGTVKDILG